MIELLPIIHTSRHYGFYFLYHATHVFITLYTLWNSSEGFYGQKFLELLLVYFSMYIALCASCAEAVPYLCSIHSHFMAFTDMAATIILWICIVLAPEQNLNWQCGEAVYMCNVIWWLSMAYMFNLVSL